MSAQVSQEHTRRLHSNPFLFDHDLRLASKFLLRFEHVFDLLVQFLFHFQESLTVGLDVFRHVEIGASFQAVAFPDAVFHDLRAPIA